jgi:hypothetical protein
MRASGGGVLLKALPPQIMQTSQIQAAQADRVSTYNHGRKW